MVHSLTEIQRRGKKRELDQPLWSWSRTTTWRRVVAVMKQADIAAGLTVFPRTCGSTDHTDTDPSPLKRCCCRTYVHR
jgi:hypothetical protein